MFQLTLNHLQVNKIVVCWVKAQFRIVRSYREDEGKMFLRKSGNYCDRTCYCNPEDHSNNTRLGVLIWNAVFGCLTVKYEH
jgi:hypothetical protein